MAGGARSCCRLSKQTQPAKQTQHPRLEICVLACFPGFPTSNGRHTNHTDTQASNEAPRHHKAQRQQLQGPTCRRTLSSAGKALSWRRSMAWLTSWMRLHGRRVLRRQ